jgi:hypothetical protein
MVDIGLNFGDPLCCSLCHAFLCVAGFMNNGNIEYCIMYISICIRCICHFTKCEISQVCLECVLWLCPMGPLYLQFFHGIASFLIFVANISFSFNLSYVLICWLYLVLMFWVKLLSRMPSSGMLCHVALVRTNVSEERITSIIKVTRIGELGIACFGC